jgi:predicted nucleic acid-binding protein
MGILRQEIPLILTASISLEYQDVLQREPIVVLTGLNHRQSTELISDLIALAREVQLHFSWRPNLQDESDNKFVEAAVHAGATIVTYDIRDYGSGDLTPYGWNWMTPHEFVTRYL